ncbi:MAG: c-type cytochrome domain-containing protein [Gemmataceae bacterium]
MKVVERVAQASRPWWILGPAALLFVAGLAWLGSERSPAAEAKVDFAKQVAPILKNYCLDCHGGRETKARFDVSSKEALLRAGKGKRKSLEPGKPDASRLYTTMAGTGGKHMPPRKEKQPSKEQIETIRKWIEEGASWPADVKLK